MFVTRRATGRFLNIGPAGIEEVLQDNLKNLLQPGEVEDNAREVVLKEFGGWMCDVDRVSCNDSSFQGFMWASTSVSSCSRPWCP